MLCFCLSAKLGLNMSHTASSPGRKKRLSGHCIVWVGLLKTGCIGKEGLLETTNVCKYVGGEGSEERNYANR